ncbi:HNH endonuclease [Marinifilum flexuosum]|uniref:Putative HNH nuclease YajD n=1 Tax=Marinifilum flexuosum TaxID=1117708 RepID=A0A419WMS4_9BACT|nr:HNH endonuclease [Marinifilum flexuosum]
MPVKPKKVHRPWERQQSKPQEGRKADDSFYHTTAWRKTSKAYRKAHPLCEECERKDRISPAEVCDHIVRIEDGGEKLDWDNLQSMCHKCHNRKSAKERHYKKQGNDKR